MKSIKKKLTRIFQDENDLVSYIENELYYYRDRLFNDYHELEDGAFKFFREQFESDKDFQDYLNKFGGDINIEKIGSVTYDIETDFVFITKVEAVYYEAYIDSGVSAESYFYGYIFKDGI